jgi:hypothetical protein
MRFAYGWLFYFKIMQTQQEEIWKDIPNYEGNYQASSLGNIKSVERKSWNGFSWIRQPEKNLKAGKNHSGYFTINLCKNGKRKMFTVHQLVAMAFLNHKPCGYKIVVDHINGINTDNRVENLQLLSNRDNVLKGNKNRILTSKYPGVCFNKTEKKFKASICVKNNKQVHLGYFKIEEDAYECYLKALELKSFWKENDDEFRKLIKQQLNQK